MVRLAPLLFAPALLLAASGPAQPVAESLDASLERAIAERTAAEAETRKLERAAEQARGEAARLQARQAAAAQAIQSAEAGITAADARLRLVSAQLALRRQRLAHERQPVSALLGGLALMARRPPLLAVADQGSAKEFVRVRVLLDATMPVIRARTAALSRQVAAGQRLEQAVDAARADMVRSRQALLERRERFAALEQQALDQATAAGAQALGTGDVAIAAGEEAERLSSARSGRREALALAAGLAALEPAPFRPIPPESPRQPAPIAYRLPVAAPVVEGLGTVSSSGVRARGLTLATSRGAAVAAPAAGIVRFSGPFRDYDGIMIIDHGGGWMSLLVNVSSQLKPGRRVRIGDPLGRALGPLGVELSRNGRRLSPALIAGSSETLSNMRKGG